MIRIASILLLASSCIAQTEILPEPGQWSAIQTKVATASGFYPTNIPGTTAYLWYNADISTFSSSTPAFWSDASGNGQGATNAGASFHPTKVSHAMGGSSPSCITFNSQNLTNLTANLTQPFTICFTMFTSNNNSGYYIADDSTHMVECDFGTFAWQAGGTLQQQPPVVTNKFATYAISFNGTSSEFWTNGIVAVASASPGTAGWTTGFGLACLANQTGGSAGMSIGDLVILSNAGTTTIASNYNYSVTNTLGWPLVQP